MGDYKYRWNGEYNFVMRYHDEMAIWNPWKIKETKMDPYEEALKLVQAHCATDTDLQRANTLAILALVRELQIQRQREELYRMGQMGRERGKMPKIVKDEL